MPFLQCFDTTPWALLFFCDSSESAVHWKAGWYLVRLVGFLPSIAARNYMLNVKLRIGAGEASFEIVGEVQITTVDYLQLREGSRISHTNQLYFTQL